jgi:N,N'-diacetyllegionaminate synthase
MTLTISKKTVGSREQGGQVYIIAEVGGNHDGDADKAHRLVDEAARAGVDAVKFQTYTADTLVHPEMESVPIARKLYKTQFERFRSLELDNEVYARLIAQCNALGLDFMTTPYDLEILNKFAPAMPAIKIASGDATYHDLIRMAAATKKPVILSTGMCNVDEIAAAVGLIPQEQRVLLHCVSTYPLPDEDVNLAAISCFLMDYPGATIGYSDHSIGIDACLGAVALGAVVLEKHFTLDRTIELGDHRLSLEPDEMAVMVEKVKRMHVMRGTGKKPVASEGVLRQMLRRGIYAARDLEAGHSLTDEDLLLIRPLTSLGADQTDRVIGRRLAHAVKAREPIDPTALH